MAPFLYEKSVSRDGHLIIPFVAQVLNGYPLYSYCLLSEWGHKGALHKAENPGGVFSMSPDGIIEVASDYLAHCDENLKYPATPYLSSTADYFKYRYTYRHHLFILFKANRKYFYDHYSPYELKNIAAPKIFTSERECLAFIRKGFQPHGRSPTSPLP
jgi:hypothetical protein